MKLHRKKKKKGRDMKKCCRLVAIFHTNNIESCADQFSSVAQLPPTVCDPMDARQASKSITNSWSLLKLMSIKLVMLSNLSHPLSFPYPPAFNLSQQQGLL